MYIFDIETDGLLEEATKVHCIVMFDTESEFTSKFGPTEIKGALEILRDADAIGGHNIMAYDLPVLKKLYNFDYYGIGRAHV